MRCAGMERVRSPSDLSTLMTSAPLSQRNIEAMAPARPLEKSNTLRPWHAVAIGEPRFTSSSILKPTSEWPSLDNVIGPP